MCRYELNHQYYLWLITKNGHYILKLKEKNDMFKNNKKLALFLITFIVFRFNSTAEAQFISPPRYFFVTIANFFILC